MSPTITAAPPPRLFVAPALQCEVEVLPLRDLILAGSPTEHYVLLILRSQAAGGQVSQVTLNLGLLLDSSQSMLGGPFAQATEGALAVMSQLDRRDRISIGTFDEQVQEIIVQGTTADLPTTSQKLRGTAMLGGRTDLEGALRAGERMLRRERRPGEADKLLLLTDGRPTAGALESLELAALADELRESGISLSCIGLGVDYDEELLMQLAERGGGYYYHSSRPRDIRKLFQREMAAFKNIHLRDIELELKLPQGFQLLQAVNAQARHVGEAHRVRLPDLEKAEESEVLLKLSSDAHPSGLFKALDLTLHATPVGQEKRASAQGFAWWHYSLDPVRLREVQNHPRVDRALTVKNVQSHLLSTMQGIKTQTLSREQAYVELKEYQKTLVLKGRTLEAMEIQQAIHLLGQGQDEEAVKELGQSAFHLQRGARPVHDADEESEG